MSQSEKQGSAFWPQKWWTIMETRIGIIPLPIFLLLCAMLPLFIITGTLTQEISMQIIILTLGGFLCAELGKKLPVLNKIGGAAICATFIPSALVYYQLLPDMLIRNISEFTKSSNFLYLFIACVIVGSIFSMDRKVLIQGFLKIFVPLSVGSFFAAIVGTFVGTMLGLGAWQTFYFIVVPIMGGGIGEGAIPLSVGYAEVLHIPPEILFVKILPSVMLGSLTAIILAGTLNYLGKKYPHLTGEGRLQPDEHDDMDPLQEIITGNMDVTHIAAAGITALSLYSLGVLGFKLFHFPAPITMMFIALIMKITHAIPPKLQEGSFVVYKFFTISVTYPLLFAIGVSLTPWDKLIEGFTFPILLTIFSTVFTLMLTGFYVGKWMRLYPIDMAIINGCHSGQGGTGDVAILTASNRMTLMPFAQIATRIGGALMVVVAIIAIAR